MTAADKRRMDGGRWLLRFPRAVPVFTFMLIAAITALSVIMIERAEDENESIRLVRAADTLSSTLERRAAATTSYLRAGAALFTSTGEFSLTDFERFVAELQLDRNYRGVEGIGWAPAIFPGEIAQFEADLSDRLDISSKVWPRDPGDPRGLLVPVSYLQPNTARNRRALGYDMYSETNRREAMDEATQRAQPVASGRITLKQEGTQESPGFLIYMPVFEGQGRERRLKGFVYSPVSAQVFLSTAAENEIENEDLATRLYDGEANPVNLLGQTGEFPGDGRRVDLPIQIADRTMTLVISSPPASALSPLSMIVLFFGLAVASLLMLVARLLTKRAYEDQQRLNWFEEQNSIRNSLTRELNHRVKNTLANVLSIMTLTRKRATDLDSFADGLSGRIRALSATHDLLTKSDWGTTPIAAVIDAELAPYRGGPNDMVTRSGPDLQLAPNDALSLGMALHELATNAAKYGALSTGEGKVSVTWELAGNGLAVIYWTETGGPKVEANRRRGFGTDLIEKVVAHELRHPVDLQFHADGVRCTLRVPIRRPTEFTMRAGQAN